MTEFEKACAENPGFREATIEEAKRIADMLTRVRTATIPQSETDRRAADRNTAAWIPLGHISRFLAHPYSEYYKCSSCGYEQYTLFMDPPAVCPHCLSGMKMKERKQDAED